MSQGRISSLLEFLRDAFTANLGLKAVSLVFALSLFTYIGVEVDKFIFAKQHKR